MLNKDKLAKIAKELGIEVVIDPTKPAGVYDEKDNSFVSYDDLFKPILKDKTMIKYQVEWKHNQADIHNKHGIFDTFEEAMDSIYEWWKVNNFEPRYVRYWTEDGVTKIDYGYHHMFYYIVECLI